MPKIPPRIPGNHKFVRWLNSLRAWAVGRLLMTVKPPLTISYDALGRRMLGLRGGTCSTEFVRVAGGSKIEYDAAAQRWFIRNDKPGQGEDTAFGPTFTRPGGDGVQQQLVRMSCVWSWDGSDCDKEDIDEEENYPPQS